RHKPPDVALVCKGDPDRKQQTDYRAGIGGGRQSLRTPIRTGIGRELVGALLVARLGQRLVYFALLVVYEKVPGGASIKIWYQQRHGLIDGITELKRVCFAQSVNGLTCQFRRTTHGVLAVFFDGPERTEETPDSNQDGGHKNRDRPAEVCDPFFTNVFNEYNDPVCNHNQEQVVGNLRVILPQVQSHTQRGDTESYPSFAAEDEVYPRHHERHE